MKVCLAGTASSKDLVYSNPLPKFLLESFYSIKEWQIPVIKQCELFLLDSGAFSFMNSAKKGVEITEKDFDEYLDKYINFINKYDIKYFFELDIDVIVGYDKVLELRKKLEEETGKKCIPVFHKNRGIKEWIKMCKEYDYVAIGTSGKNDSKWTRTHPEVLYKMLKIAKENNCKVHGLGYTSMTGLTKLHFYSVDSTTWQEGSRFGVVHLFDGKTVQKIHNKDRSLRTVKTINEHNYPQWLKFQDYADKHL